MEEEQRLQLKMLFEYLVQREINFSLVDAGIKFDCGGSLSYIVWEWNLSIRTQK